MTAASSELERLRIAQATRVPVTAGDVAAALADDELVGSPSAEQVAEVLGELADRGLVEELPGDRWLLCRLFDSDMDRRAAANLSRPLTVEGLQAVLRSDPAVGQVETEDLRELLLLLSERGLVKSLGDGHDAAGLVEAAVSDEETVELPEDKASALAERLAAPERAWQLRGEQWMLTSLGKEALVI